MVNCATIYPCSSSETYLQLPPAVLEEPSGVITAAPCIQMARVLLQCAAKVHRAWYNTVQPEVSANYFFDEDPENLKV